MNITTLWRHEVELQIYFIDITHSFIVSKSLRHPLRALAPHWRSWLCLARRGCQQRVTPQHPTLSLECPLCSDEMRVRQQCSKNGWNEDVRSILTIKVTSIPWHHLAIAVLFLTSCVKYLWNNFFFKKNKFCDILS